MNNYNFNDFLFNCIILFLFSFGLIAQEKESDIYLHVLGTVQDGGSPHLGCKKECCLNLSEKEKNFRKVTSIEIFNPVKNESILFEATPDIIYQWNSMYSPPKGIFLTHAHIGHYSGLIHLGKEALGAKGISVYAMPKMSFFLKENGPWSQLVKLGNIRLVNLDKNIKVSVLGKIKVTPLLVPHRDEFSETVGYKIEGPSKTVLFIPDIDKWLLWDQNLIDLLETVDMAFIDGTFFSAKEVNYRPISEIPHPLVEETIKFLSDQKESVKNKVYFIHMNHTNPLLDPKSKESKWVLSKGFRIAQIGQVFGL